MESPRSVPPAPTLAPLRVLFLGPLRHLQSDTQELTCPKDGSQSAFWSALQDQFPQLIAEQKRVRLARNGEFLAPLDRLEPGDEIALIPPVSGG